MTTAYLLLPRLPSESDKCTWGAKKSGLMDDTKQEGARDPWSPGEATVHQLPEWGSLSFFWAFFSLLVSFMSQFLFDHCSNVKRIWLTAIFFEAWRTRATKERGCLWKLGQKQHLCKSPTWEQKGNQKNLRSQKEAKETKKTDNEEVVMERSKEALEINIGGKHVKVCIKTHLF